MIKIDYTLISPNKTKRTAKIDTITIHHAAGNVSVEQMGKQFQTSDRGHASANYGIGTDGRIALYVEENYKANTSTNSANDNRAITFEVANDGGASTDWHISDKALNALIELVADCCKRNDIKALKWSDNKDDRIKHKDGCNMTVHKDFVATECPGKYLMSKMNYIASEVNKKLMNSNQVWEYDKIECKVGDIKGVMLKCDKVDLCVLGDISIKKMIYPYTSRKGDKGIYLEFTPYNKGNHKMIDKLTNKDIDIIVN